LLEATVESDETAKASSREGRNRLLADMLAGIQVPDDLGNRRSSSIVRSFLRDQIVAGQIPPGAILSQLEISDFLGVSRTPVREALRMLQEEGLVEATPNHRARVREIDPRELEDLYATRILLESLAVKITIQRLENDGIKAIETHLERLSDPACREDVDEWMRVHSLFHGALVSGAGPEIVDNIRRLEQRTSRYRYLRKAQHGPYWWLRGEREHRDIVGAIVAGHPDRAGELLARHLARTALNLLGEIVPEYDPAAVRHAVRMASSGAAPD